MKIRLFSFGKLKEPAFKILCEDYLKRIQRFHDFSLEEIPDESVHAKIPLEKILEKESARLLKRIKPGTSLVLFDLEGQPLDSLTFSKKFEKILESGASELAFVIGSAHGFAKSLKARAQFRWSLSKLTFPHQLARVIAMEQIYRAWTLMKNMTYHY